jgi:hypothetical protein
VSSTGAVALSAEWALPRFRIGQSEGRAWSQIWRRRHGVLNSGALVSDLATGVGFSATGVGV